MTELSKKYVLLNVYLVDGHGGYPEKDMFVEIDGKEISAVGKMKDYRKKNDFRGIDLKGFYVMPGMIDAHVHLAGGRGTGEYGDTEIMTEPKMLRAMRSVYESQKILKRGFTSVRDISWNGLYLKRIFGEGIMPGPRIIACGPGLARTGGHCDSYQFPEEFVLQEHFWAVQSDGPEECRKWVRRILRQGADQIKFWATGGDNWPTDRVGDRHYSFEEIKMIVDEAHMIQGTLVCSHAETFETIKMSVDAGCDTIEHGEDLNEEYAEIMRDRDIILVPTMKLLANWFTEVFPMDKEPEPSARPHAFLHRTVDNGPWSYTQEQADKYMKQVKDSFVLAREKGVKIALGSDTVYEPASPYGEYSALEFKELVRFGMTVPEAIKAATKTAAEALGMAHRIGTVEPGKLADLLVVKKDPTESEDVLYDADNITWIISGGRMAVEDGRLAF